MMKNSEKKKLTLLVNSVLRLGEGEDPGAVAAPSAPAPTDTSEENGLDWGELAVDFDTIDAATDPAESGDTAIETSDPENGQADTPDVSHTPEKVEQKPAEKTEPQTVEKPAEKATEVKEEKKPEEKTPAQPSQITQEDYSNQRSKLVEEMTKAYSLDDQAAAALVTEPEKVLPRMLAELHMTVYEQAVQTVANMIPQMFAAQQNAVKVTEQNRNAFYEKWPMLKEHEGDVLRVATQYRQMNPGATLEQAIQDVGAHVIIQKRIPVPGLTITNETATPAKANQPFRPAATGGSTTPPPKQDTGKFANLINEFEEDA